MTIKYELHSTYPEFKNELLNIKTLFKQDNSVIHNARNILKVIPLHNIDTVVKAFKVPNIINQFAYSYIRKSKAHKSYFNALKLENLGVNTPSPIGFIEFYHRGFFKESFYLSKYHPYDFTMKHVIVDKPRDQKEILLAFTHFTYELHKKGVWHVDYSPGNILISYTDHTYHFALVDINRMQFKTISGYEGLTNFNKLWANENELTIIAKEYAHLANLDETQAIEGIITQDKLLKKHVSRRRQLKALFKKISTTFKA